MKSSTFLSKAVMLFSLMLVMQTTSLFAAEFSVKFLRVEAEQVDDEIVVRWVTDSEFDNDFFTVQRSNDGGLNWQALGNTESSGNTPGEGVYTYIDDIPEIGTNTYRIQQTDLDGTYTYSFTTNAEFSFFTEEEDTEIQIYPNPSSDVVTVASDIEFSDNVSIELMDLSGKLIGVEADLNDKIINIRPIKKLSGLYFIMITDRNKNTVRKVKFK